MADLLKSTKRRLLRLRNFVNDNKVWLELVVTILLGYMAIRVSITQNSISNNQTNLIKRQTKLLETQTQLTNEELIHSRENDAAQNEIAQKQLKILNLQTAFLYVPNLKVKLDGMFNLDYKLEFINKGKSDISEIRIFNSTGLYFTYDNEFFIFMRATAPFKVIKNINPGQKVVLKYDTARTVIHYNNYEVSKNEALESKNPNPKWKYLVIPIEIYEIKYKSKPDLEEYSLTKYFRIMRGSKSGNLMIDDQEVWPISIIDNKVLRSTPLR